MGVYIPETSAKSKKKFTMKNVRTQQNIRKLVQTTPRSFGGSTSAETLNGIATIPIAASVIWPENAAIESHPNDDISTPAERRKNRIPIILRQSADPRLDRIRIVRRPHLSTNTMAKLLPMSSNIPTIIAPKFASQLDPDSLRTLAVQLSRGKTPQTLRPDIKTRLMIIALRVV